MQFCGWFFLFEGVKDQENQRLGYLCTAELIEFFEKRPKTSQSFNGHAIFEFRYKGNDTNVKKTIDKMIIDIIATEERVTGRASYSLDEKTNRGVLKLWVSVGKIPSAEMWAVYAQNKAADIFEKYEEVIFHECVHAVELKKTASHGKSDPYRTEYDATIVGSDAEETERYYNSPAEYNAEVHQAIYKIDKNLQGAKSMNDVKRILNTPTANEFVQTVLRHTTSGFQLNISDDTYRHVVKRAYQYWRDLEDRFPD